jgi:hypothetical protein
MFCKQREESRPNLGGTEPSQRSAEQNSTMKTPNASKLIALVISVGVLAIASPGRASASKIINSALGGTVTTARGNTVKLVSYKWRYYESGDARGLARFRFCQIQEPDPGRPSFDVIAVDKEGNRTESIDYGRTYPIIYQGECTTYVVEWDDVAPAVSLVIGAPNFSSTIRWNPTKKVTKANAFLRDVPLKDVSIGPSPATAEIPTANTQPLTSKPSIVRRRGYCGKTATPAPSEVASSDVPCGVDFPVELVGWREVTCFRDNGAAREGLAIGPAETCQSRGYQGQVG